MRGWMMVLGALALAGCAPIKTDGRVVTAVSQLDGGGLLVKRCRIVVDRDWFNGHATGVRLDECESAEQEPLAKPDE